MLGIRIIKLIVGCLLFASTLFYTSCKKEEDVGDNNGGANSNGIVLTTAPVTSIFGSGAICGGNVTNDGGSPIIARGVCWGASSNPTTSDNFTSNGIGLGSFTSTLLGLTNGVTYYVRAYATNSIGTSYGNQVTFVADSTSLGPIVLSTLPVTNISGSDATCGGNIISDGGAPIIARGVCWGTNVNPTTADNFTTEGTGLGTFNSVISGLANGTTYYVRAYASNSNGISYGNELSFTTNNGGQQLNIIDVRNLYNGFQTTINGNYFISGVVISDRTTLNINSKNIFIQDGTAGIIVRFLTDHTFNIGDSLLVNVSGQTLGEYNGLLQIGIGFNTGLDIASATVIATGKSILPRSTTIAQILSNMSNNDSWEGTLVRLDNVTISSSTGTATYGGAVQINDGTGQMTLYTQLSASFANSNFPIGTVNITGVLSEFNGSIVPPNTSEQIWLRSQADVQ